MAKHGEGEMKKRTFVVTRFDPDQDQVPKTQSYEVPCRPEWKVLDALNFIKDEIDPTLSHRWSCRMAVCGSCGMNVDGEPKLTCKTSLAEYGDTVEIAPLARETNALIDANREIVERARTHVGNLAQAGGHDAQRLV